MNGVGPEMADAESQLRSGGRRLTSKGPYMEYIIRLPTSR